MRQALTIILPLLLPALIYLLIKSQKLGSFKLAARDAPWVWLSAGGVAFAAVVLVTWAWTSGAPADALYEPPTYEDGKLVPGKLITPESSNK
jgi:hypothetical protein